MPLFSKILRLSLVCSIVLCLAGCGGEPRPDGFPTLYPVSLQFMQEGEPVAEAAVVLLPQDGSKWSSGGATDSDGIATFRTHGKFSGVPAGRYKVMVTKQEVVPRGAAAPDPLGTYGGPVDVYDLISPDFFQPDATPLEIEVVSGRNTFEPIDLGKKVRIRVPPTF